MSIYGSIITEKRVPGIATNFKIDNIPVEFIYGLREERHYYDEYFKKDLYLMKEYWDKNKVRDFIIKFYFDYILYRRKKDPNYAYDIRSVQDASNNLIFEFISYRIFVSYEEGENGEETDKIYNIARHFNIGILFKHNYEKNDSLFFYANYFTDLYRNNKIYLSSLNIDSNKYFMQDSYKYYDYYERDED